LVDVAVIALTLVQLMNPGVLNPQLSEALFMEFGIHRHMAIYKLAIYREMLIIFL